MMLTVLPVPSAAAPDAGACSVTVFVSPPQATRPTASSDAAAMDMRSRVSDMTYLL